MKWQRTMAAAMVCGCVMIFSGCTVAQPERPPINDTHVYDADFDTAWNAVIGIMAQKNVPIKAIEKDSGIITTDVCGIRLSSGVRYADYVVYPNIPFGIWNAPTWRASILVRKDKDTSPNTTRIRISTQLAAFESNMTGTWHECSSTGLLEDHFFEALSVTLKEKHYPSR